MSKGLEALKRIALKDFILNDESCLKDIKIIEKELKVLEIIKNKRVDLDLLLRTFKFNNYQLYNFEMSNGERNLIKEEYDLFIEVLL